MEEICLYAPDDFSNDDSVRIRISQRKFGGVDE